MKFKPNINAAWMAAGLIIGLTVIAVAQQTNFLGTVFVADPTIPTRQLKVNADGSLNISGGGGGVTTPLTTTDRSIAISATVTAQAVAAANTSRKSLTVENPCTAIGQGLNVFAYPESIVVTNSAGTNYEIAPCQQWLAQNTAGVDQGAVTAAAATMGHVVVATEGQ
jgi:hypothetical protein